MAKNTKLWSEVEDKLKSLTSSLQSLPSEMREKALHFITKEMSAEDTNRSPVKDKVVSTVAEIHGTPTKTSPKKRVDQNLNGHVSESPTVTPSSSCILEPKKRGRPRLNRSPEKAESVSEIQLPKKRGRPPKSATLSTMVEDVETEVVPRSSGRVRRKPKTYFEEDEDLFTEHVQKDGEDSVILVPVDEHDLSAEINQMASSLDNNDNDSTDENLSYDENSQMEKTERSSRQRAGNRSRKSSASDSDIAEDALLESSRVKKRGRPRKKELKTRIKSEDDPDFLADSSSSRKKSIGRPRFSTYVLGYVPKPKLYKCTECGKDLSSRASLREHVRRHTGDLYMCDLCGQKFSTNSGFLLHKKYHGNDPNVFKCTHCRYTVSTKQLLDDHVETRHNPNRPREHICYVCGKGFHTTIQLEKHLVSHSISKPYVCDECDFSTAYAGGLEKHKYNVHEKEHRRLFECELCHAKLRSRGTYMNTLAAISTSVTRSVISVRRRFPLASHRRCHSDPKIPCEVCGKLLRNKHKMKVHMFLHTGQKDFACPFCSYVTYVKHNLKKHCLVRHKVEYPPVDHPRMKKFRAEHARTIALSLTDPVAVRCVQKMVHSSDEDEENHQEERLELAESANAEPSAVNNKLAEDSSSHLQSCLSESTLVDTMQVTVAHESLAASFSQADSKSDLSGQQTSIVSNMVPIYTLPLFSYGLQGNFISTGTTTTQVSSSVEEKRYITLTPTSMTSNPQRNIVIAPSFNYRLDEPSPALNRM